ncbi:MAG: ACT domain-containing protein [Acidaminococcaceae bacterium]|nr:ACT domain-containing protein [Acidaminococcaceae bacterium]
MRIVITVLGRDKVGIVARVATTCAEEKINIVDINQNIMEGFFNMVLLADMSDDGISFKAAQEKFTKLGDEMGLEIRLQSEEIFKAMHRV